ncbi:DNA-binding response regulator [Elizabethkingia anophelis]|uniref:response regulator transcription factor n=1 Tax=Elizabethkingia anophelis TaxID=1117645 RepID=UPI0013700775|nr:response regulator transcription factor [Elizabethkingia anophelis]MYY49928.1 DNA-binding response regulator [Elizabethkingia anophelis]
MNILLVEDDVRISSFILMGLKEYNYHVLLASTGKEAREMVENNTFDIILMDIMLPDLDGIELTGLIRFKNISTPILILSALNSVDTTTKVLDLGADDYITKPFHFEELISRIKALVRRNTKSYNQNDDIITCLDLKIDVQRYIVTQHGKEIELSPKEFLLLLYLVKSKNRVLSRAQILQVVWGVSFDPGTNIVDVYISYLRNKLDESEYKFIHTVKGIGYMLKDEI